MYLNAFLLFDVDANAPPSVCVRRSASSPRHDPPAATMGKAAGHKEKKDAKRAIKDKKKFKNRNSIGKTRKKGSKYMTRTQAVAKLQVPLKDFRKLCILKGVYPREPKKKAKGGNTTYFFAKDILFLQHEPILAAFREQKAFLKKIRRAAGRHERVQAERLDGRRPTYKLDHLIRERYPRLRMRFMSSTTCCASPFSLRRSRHPSLCLRPVWPSALGCARNSSPT